MFLDTEASTSKHASKLAMGTRGYVESMLWVTTYEAGQLFMKMRFCIACVDSVSSVQTCLCHMQIWPGADQDKA